jgi:hypothetical protein
MESCAICLGELPPWQGRGRPRTYCSKLCRDNARYLRELEQAAEFWRERGYAQREAHVLGVIERRRAGWRADHDPDAVPRIPSGMPKKRRPSIFVDEHVSPAVKAGFTEGGFRTIEVARDSAMRDEKDYIEEIYAANEAFVTADAEFVQLVCATELLHPAGHQFYSLSPLPLHASSRSSPMLHPPDDTPAVVRLVSARLAPFSTTRCCGRECRRARVRVGQRPPRLGHVPGQSRGLRHARRVGDADRALLDHRLLQERPV